MAEFNELCESITSIKTSRTLRYPRQIQLSEEFLSSLKNELTRFMTIQESSNDIIRNFKEKFEKALHFEILEHCGHCDESKKEDQRKKNRDNMKEKRKDPTFRSYEQYKNRKRMAKNRHKGTKSGQASRKWLDKGY